LEREKGARRVNKGVLVYTEYREVHKKATSAEGGDHKRNEAKGLCIPGVRRDREVGPEKRQEGACHSRLIQLISPEAHVKREGRGQKPFKPYLECDKEDGGG